MCREEFETLVQDNPKYVDALNRLDAGFEDAMQYITEPEAYHKSLRTTNSLERINQEIRRRERVVRIFPTIASAELLIGSVLLDIHEEIQKRDIVFLKS